MFFAEMVHVCMAYVWIDAKSLRVYLDLKLFSTWRHSLDYFRLFLVRKSLVFESCGMFSLQEVGLFICYQPTSAMDSVWTLM